MQPLTGLQASFLSALYGAASGLTIDVERYLSRAFFTSAAGRALILQPSGRFGYFYLKPNLFAIASTRNKELSDFLGIVMLLKDLTAAGKIFYIQNPDVVGHDPSIQCISDSFNSPHISASSIILNSQGDFTSHPRTIKNSSGADIYHGIKIDGPLFDIVNSVLRGAVYMCADVAKLVSPAPHVDIISHDQPSPQLAAPMSVKAPMPSPQPVADVQIPDPGHEGAHTADVLNPAHPMKVSDITLAVVEAISVLQEPSPFVKVAGKTLLWLLTALVPLSSLSIYQGHNTHTKIDDIKKSQGELKRSVDVISKSLAPPPLAPVTDKSGAVTEAAPPQLVPSSPPEPAAPAIAVEGENPSSVEFIAPPGSAREGRLSTFGFDLSKWNGELAKKALSTPHVGFVIVRSTYGITRDPDFDTNWALIHKYRVQRGAYHFYVASEDPIRQAKHFLMTIGRIEPDAIAPVVDFEDLSFDAAALKQEPAQVKERLLQALNYIETETKRTPILYTSIDAGNKYLADAKFSRFPLWIADWTNKKSPALPVAWKSVGYTYWQRSSSYTLGGRSAAPIDMDVFIGVTQPFGAKKTEAK